MAENNRAGNRLRASVKVQSMIEGLRASRAVLDVLPVGLLLLDQQHRIEFSNPKVQQLLGYSADELNGMPVDQLVPADLRAAHRHHRQDFQRHSRSRAMDDGGILSAQHKNGQRIYVKIGLSPVDTVGQPRVLITLVETTNAILKVAECYDSLTGLANRQLFYRMSETLRHLAQRNQVGVGLLFLDLDQFKAVNDRYGHATGDALIRAVGEKLLASVRKQDVVGRLGGDEFAICLYNLNSETLLQRFCRSLAGRVAAIDLPGHPEVSASISIGAVFLDPLSEDDCNASLDDWLARADQAMYRNKQQRRASA